jgi:hypothetical protein
MNYRSDLILSATAMPSAAGTKVIDILVTKPISRIEIAYQTTKVLATNAYGVPACIPKIELVDGSKPLHSLTGYTNQALAYYSRGNVAMEHGQHIRTQEEVAIYAIDFGRFLHDPLLAFDPKRFDNPQLKITWNRIACDASATPDSMEIWAELFDEKAISPFGFLSAREIWSGNFLANNSVNEVLLPEDEVIRQLLVRANQAAYEPWYQVDIAKLDEAAGGAVIFDYIDLEKYYQRMKSRWPMIKCPFIGGFDGGAETFYIPQTDYDAWINGVAEGADGATHVGAASCRGGKAVMHSTAGANLVGESGGYLPWHTFQFPFGNQQDPEDWYDPTDKKPRLRLTSNTGGVSGDGNVVIETIHRY